MSHARHRAAKRKASMRASARMPTSDVRPHRLRATVHWVIRGISIVGLAAAGWAYVHADRIGIEFGTKPLAEPGPPSGSPSPTWEPPVVAEPQSARAAFIGNLSGDVGSIPPVARAAYDTAARVIADADVECRLDWTLLAGVGWVETEHGLRGGSWLAQSGTMQIPLYGPALSPIDTDGGNLDERDDVDRPVGPLQFTPSVWTEVGVDANGDGQRNPQDIYDAALGLAVFLCAGDGSIDTPAAASHALSTFNKVAGYADAVLIAAAHYAATGDSNDGFATDGQTEIVTIQVPELPTETPAPSPSPTRLPPKPAPSPPSPMSPMPQVPVPAATTTPSPTPTSSPSPSQTSTPTTSGAPAATPTANATAQ